MAGWFRIYCGWIGVPVDALMVSLVCVFQLDQAWGEIRARAEGTGIAFMHVSQLLQLTLVHVDEFG